MLDIFTICRCLVFTLDIDWRFGLVVTRWPRPT